VHFGPLTKKVIEAHVDQPKWTFSGYKISALKGSWSLKFLHALEIDLSLLTHIPNGERASPEKFSGRTLKIWLKIHHMRACNFGISGSDLTQRSVSLSGRPTSDREKQHGGRNSANFHVFMSL